MDSRMDQYQGNDIEVLLEQLESLRITEEDTLNKTTKTEITDKMLIVLALVLAVYNEQAVMPKSMVSDSE